MTADIDSIAHLLIEDDSRLSPAVVVVQKVHAMLPDDLMMASWTLLPGRIDGQVGRFGDAVTIAWIASLANRPGWHLEQSDRQLGEWTHRSYIQVSAVTEVDGVEVKIWTHVDADTVMAFAGAGVAA